jgi:hypothetical protein
MSAASIDAFLNSRHRASWPGGYTYSFLLPNVLNVEQSTSFQIVLNGAQIPNQYANIFTGINDTIYWQFSQPPAGYNADNTVHSYTFPPGNYTASSFAADLQSGIAASFPAQWAMPMAGDPTYAIGYDPVQGTLQWTITSGFGLSFLSNGSESQSGSPPMYPSQRLSQMLGLHKYYQGNPGWTILTTGGSALNTELIWISGSKYVDLLVNFNTGNLNSDPYISGHTLARIPLGALGTVTNFVRYTDDRGLFLTEGNNLKQIKFDLVDEWGVPFFLPSSAQIGIQLRMYPGQSSDYSG